MEPNRVELNCTPSSRRVRQAIVGAAALAAAALALTNLPARHTASPVAAPAPRTLPVAISVPAVSPLDDPDDAVIDDLPLDDLTVRLARFCEAMRDEFDLDPETGLRPFAVGCPQA